MVHDVHSIILSQIYDGKEQAEFKDWHLAFH
jgi:hypothetical protein